ncbi:hypothetical protein MKX03_029563 [Papaver bracteatum]|nr:hypothetical protein MKX03_029563 [Papaver bracteatum]
MLKKDDIVLAFYGVPIANDGTVPFQSQLRFLGSCTFVREQVLISWMISMLGMSIWQNYILFSLLVT